MYIFQSGPEQLTVCRVSDAVSVSVGDMEGGRLQRCLCTYVLPAHTVTMHAEGFTMSEVYCSTCNCV